MTPLNLVKVVSSRYSEYGLNLNTFKRERYYNKKWKPAQKLNEIQEEKKHSTGPPLKPISQEIALSIMGQKISEQN